jgi:hypothetical protein
MLKQRKKAAKDPLLKTEIRADMEREALEKETAEKKRKGNDIRENARLRLEQVIKELQSSSFSVIENLTARKLN